MANPPTAFWVTTFLIVAFITLPIFVLYWRRALRRDATVETGDDEQNSSEA